jgi:hypothetical protein
MAENAYLKGLDPSIGEEANIESYLNGISKAEGADYDTIVKATAEELQEIKRIQYIAGIRK